MKICSSCGASIGDNEKFCSKCGAQQIDLNQEWQAGPDQNAQNETRNQYQQNTQNGYSRMQGQPNGGYQQGQSGGQYNNMQSAPPTSGMAIASLVLSIVGIFVSWFTFAIPSILGLIFGIIALKPCKNGEKGGYGMAIAGLIISLIIIVIFIIVIIWVSSITTAAINGAGLFNDLYRSMY